MRAFIYIRLAFKKSFYKGSRQFFPPEICFFAFIHCKVNNIFLPKKRRLCLCQSLVYVGYRSTSQFYVDYRSASQFFQQETLPSLVARIPFRDNFKVTQATKQQATLSTSQFLILNKDIRHFQLSVFLQMWRITRYDGQYKRFVT